MKNILKWIVPAVYIVLAGWMLFFIYSTYTPMQRGIYYLPMMEAHYAWYWMPVFMIATWLGIFGVGFMVAMWVGNKVSEK